MCGSAKSVEIVLHSGITVEIRIPYQPVVVHVKHVHNLVCKLTFTSSPTTEGMDTRSFSSMTANLWNGPSTRLRWSGASKATGRSSPHTGSTPTDPDHGWPVYPDGLVDLLAETESMMRTVRVAIDPPGCCTQNDPMPESL